MGRATRLIAAATVVLATGCGPRPREYPLQGVVLAVDPGRLEITIKHDDIPRFMPAMTMPFKVRDARLLEGRAPGDLVRATLVVEDADAHLRAIERIGTAAVPAPVLSTSPAVLERGAAVRDVSLTDQHGAQRRLSEWRGLVLAVTFVYTRCPIPNFCPLMDAHFRSVQDAVKKDGQLRSRVRLVSVSLDPAYDRPDVLDAHARRLGADRDVWTFVTGEATEIEKFGAQFGVSIVAGKAPAEEIVHNLRTAVIGGDGSLSTVLRGAEWTPEELVAELRKAVAPR